MKVWKTADVEQEVVNTICRRYGTAPSHRRYVGRPGLYHVRRNRPFSSSAIKRAFRPASTPRYAAAVERIQKAIAREESIVVLGDYDVDGITSTALLVNVLRHVGATVNAYLPHRVDDGYGFGVEPFEKCIAAFNPALIITVDCGTNSVEAVEHARRVNVDVIISDHHEPGEQTAPAVALVNPKRGHDEDAKMLAGVGVAFKLCHALIKKLRAEDHELSRTCDLRRYLELVAVGTIADMLPLQGENRALARFGLHQLSRTPSIGLKTLMDVAGISTGVEAYHVAFQLGPRLNAAGRLGAAMTSLELLLADDEAWALPRARELDATNQERQKKELEVVEEATRKIESYFDPAVHFGLVAASPAWHPGVIGIVASRLCRRFRRPAVVIAIGEDGTGKGSCRSVPEFNIVEGLEACSDLLNSYGGHQIAAGLQIDTVHIESLQERFNEAAVRSLKNVDLRPAPNVDDWVHLREMDTALVEALEGLRPFGLETRGRYGPPARLRYWGSPGWSAKTA